MRLYEGLGEKRGTRESREYNMETQLLPRDDVLHTHTHTHLPKRTQQEEQLSREYPFN